MNTINASPARKARILWIEDDLRYARLLDLELGHLFSFEVRSKLDDQAMQLLAGVDGVIIDMNLASGRVGPDAFQRVRELGYEGPVFVLSNDETVASKLQMLSLGVDDYLWKVMPTQELELRLMNAIQRHWKKLQRPAPRSGLDGRPGLSLAGLELQLDSLICHLNGRPLDLSKIEFKILLVLFRHHPQGAPLDLLKQEVWGQSFVNSGTISTFIWKLNKKTQGWSHRIVRSKDEIHFKPLQ